MYYAGTSAAIKRYLLFLPQPSDGNSGTFHVSFHIDTGEFVAIVGPSGCGKSTLLSIIAGLLPPEEGTIVFHNPDGSFHYPKIGYMLQRDHLLEWRTVYQNAILGLEINKMLTQKIPTGCCSS